MIFKRKTTRIKESKNNSTLDQVLWLIENYLPQKNTQARRKELQFKELEVSTINQIQKFASLRSKSLTPSSKQKKLTFTVGVWALPYLKLLKQTGLIK